MAHRRALALAATLAAAALPAASSAAPPAVKPTPVQAAPRRAPSGSVPLPPSTLQRLKSGDSARVKSALDDVRVSATGGVAAVPFILDLLRSGLSPSLTLAALDTLGDAESETASEVVSWYTRHRNLLIRRSATAALAKTRGPAAALALRAALADSDGEVRGLAATGLGTLKAKDAMLDLFAALDRKVPEAAVAIGQLCIEPECEELAGKMGRMPFEVITSGLDEILLRPASDVKDDVKIKIVGRVRELGTAEANHFLRDVQTRWPAHTSPRVKQAIDQAVLATANSPGSDGRESAR